MSLRKYHFLIWATRPTPVTSPTLERAPLRVEKLIRILVLQPVEQREGPKSRLVFKLLLNFRPDFHNGSVRVRQERVVFVCARSDWVSRYFRAVFSSMPVFLAVIASILPAASNFQSFRTCASVTIATSCQSGSYDSAQYPQNQEFQSSPRKSATNATNQEF